MPAETWTNQKPSRTDRRYRYSSIGVVRHDPWIKLGFQGVIYHHAYRVGYILNNRLTRMVHFLLGAGKE